QHGMAQIRRFFADKIRVVPRIGAIDFKLVENAFYVEGWYRNQTTIEEFFNAFNGQYLLISMDKGMVTWCDIEYLVGRFL
ncbi:MAG: hypothetical protein FWC11_02100, partial [Firmicutes bacterium]|nr:hypothetical protein [Bacillota bacterium]MCL2255632.1 hypothetical protein [Bacillota bacterium]